MAKFPGRGGRASSRHTGRQYGAGYQFRPSQQTTVKHGPWQAVELAGSDDPRMLQLAGDAVVRDGGVQAYSENVVPTTVTFATSSPLGAFRFVIDGTGYVLIFYKNTSTGYITVYSCDESGTENTDASTLTATNAEPIAATVWGDLVYFGSKDLGSLYSYDISTGTFAAITGSPANVEYLVIIDNNMVAGWYDTSSNYWIIEWAVDSDPTDWSSAGHGTEPLANTLGPLKCLLKVGEEGFIGCMHGARMMGATGAGEPAFAFYEATNFKTIKYARGACSDGYGVTYLALDKRFHYWASGQDSIYNEGMPGSVNDDNKFRAMAYLENLDMVLVHIDSVNTLSYLLDPHTRRIVGTRSFVTSSSKSFITDSHIETTTYGLLPGYEIIYENTGATYRSAQRTDQHTAACTIDIAPISPGVQVEVESVDIYVDDTDTTGSLALNFYDRSGTKTTATYNLTGQMGHEDADFFRVPTHVVGMNIQARLTIKLAAEGCALRKVVFNISIPDQLGVGLAR